MHLSYKDGIVLPHLGELSARRGPSLTRYRSSLSRTSVQTLPGKAARPRPARSVRLFVRTWIAGCGGRLSHFFVGRRPVTNRRLDLPPWAVPDWNGRQVGGGSRQAIVAAWPGSGETALQVASLKLLSQAPIFSPQAGISRGEKPVDTAVYDARREVYDLVYCAPLGI
jgi:hypothetical protein